MVTQEDIAKKLNISRTTVARALNGNSNIKPETKEKILDLCNEMGYVKNPISTSLATKKEKKVYAFLVKSKNSHYSLELMKGLKKAEKEFEFYRYSIEIIQTDINNPQEQLNELDRVIKEEQPEGIIIIPLLKQEIKQIKLKNYKIFFVTLDINIDDSIVNVGVDYFKSGRITADIFMNVINKNKKILVLDTVDDMISSKLYLKGFLSRIKEEDENLIVGPIYDNNLRKNAVHIIKNTMDKNIEGIYSTRFLTDIVVNVKKELKTKFKVVANGMNDIIYDLILNKSIVATVVERWEEEGYVAAKIMFNYMYKNVKPTFDNYIAESKIMFRENLRY
ncbi:LacI family DNA-binding transcriptional regulator [Clostridium massiliodielmoense]|uniref:substrate-binding domain-containing protein n=1 Tax=Clostridium massiliodielmoense TaxID=1776385 RepID=UPI000A271D93|nr:LacI family DNA-binding transcriptional regulator [Clostridium massiliodielmoense]